VGLPVDVIGIHREEGLEERVLHDVDVLPGDHLEDLFGGVEIGASLLPRP